MRRSGWQAHRQTCRDRHPATNDSHNVNRSLPDADLDRFVDALATRIASFNKQTIMDTKRLVNIASLPPDIEIESGWNACVASMGRPATQQRIKTLIERGFCKPGDAENRLG